MLETHYARESGGMADAQGSGPCEGNFVGVQVPPLAPQQLEFAGRSSSEPRRGNSRASGGRDEPTREAHPGLKRDWRGGQLFPKIQKAHHRAILLQLINA